MGRIILHDTMGFLADFDPFGKQEFTWTPNAQHAWCLQVTSQLWQQCGGCLDM